MKFLIAQTLLMGILAQASASMPKPKVAPTLTESQKLAYYKAALESNTANNNVQQTTQVARQKQEPLNAAIKVLVDACGKDFHPDMDTNVGLVCAANPDSVKAAEVRK